MSPIYTGLDVGSSQFHLFGLDEDGQLIADQQINHNTTREQTEEKLSCTIEDLPGDVILHKECCDMASWLPDVLDPVTDQIIVSNPLTNSWISKDPDKQDRLDAEKLVALFNGENLNGWETVGGPAESWTVNDRVLSTTGEGVKWEKGEGGGWLSTTEPYSDFTLSLEFKLSEEGNIGVFLRAVE